MRQHNQGLEGEILVIMITDNLTKIFNEIYFNVLLALYPVSYNRLA